MLSMMFWLVAACTVVGVLSWIIERMPIRLVQILLVPVIGFALWVTGAWEWVWHVLSY